MVSNKKIQGYPEGISTQKLAKKSQLAELVNKDGFQSEFDKMLGATENKEAPGELKFSQHAVKRLRERELSVDNEEFLKIKEAVQKLKLKGGHDSLVVTKSAAYIVDVDKNLVVTAIDKDQLGENVFTKIDSTMFVN